MKKDVFDNSVFISHIISDVFRIPTRIFKQGVQMYSTLSLFLQKDAFNINVADIPHQTIGIFVDESKCNYGYIRIDEYCLIFGPTREIPFSKKEIDDMFDKYALGVDDYATFSNGMKALGCVAPLELAQILALVIFALTGEKKTTGEIIVEKEQLQNFEKRINESEASSQIDWTKEPVDLNRTYIAEQQFISCIQNGDIERWNRFVKNYQTIRDAKKAEGQLRQTKNTFITATTIASSAAINGGLDVNEAFALSGIYSAQCEQLNDIGAVLNLQYKMSTDFLTRVRATQIKTMPKLVFDVKAYVNNNISEPITTQDIADYLCLSRSYLSTAFKQQAGVTLAEFITKEKINEACRLLTYTNKTMLEISEGLGFSSQSHFTATFKKFTGKTPKQMKKEPR